MIGFNFFSLLTGMFLPFLSLFFLPGQDLPTLPLLSSGLTLKYSSSYCPACLRISTRSISSYIYRSSFRFCRFNCEWRRKGNVATPPTLSAKRGSPSRQGTSELEAWDVLYWLEWNQRICKSGAYSIRELWFRKPGDWCYWLDWRACWM